MLCYILVEGFKAFGADAMSLRRGESPVPRRRRQCPSPSDSALYAAFEYGEVVRIKERIAWTVVQHQADLSKVICKSLANLESSSTLTSSLQSCAYTSTTVSKTSPTHILTRLVDTMKFFALAVLAVLPAAFAQYTVTSYLTEFCDATDSARALTATGTESTDCLTFSSGQSIHSDIGSCTLTVYSDGACSDFLGEFLPPRPAICDTWEGGLTVNSWKVSC